MQVHCGITCSEFAMRWKHNFKNLLTQHELLDTTQSSQLFTNRCYSNVFKTLSINYCQKKLIVGKRRIRIYSVPQEAKGLMTWGISAQLTWAEISAWLSKQIFLPVLKNLV